MLLDKSKHGNIMTNKVIEEALSGFRDLLLSEIANELRSTKSRKVKLDLSLPCSIDEDRYNRNYIKAIYLDKNDRVMVKYTDDWGDNEVYHDGIDMFTVDEILEIINAI